jgi:hypothetical protein
VLNDVEREVIRPRETPHRRRQQQDDFPTRVVHQQDRRSQHAAGDEQAEQALEPLRGGAVKFGGRVQSLSLRYARMPAKARANLKCRHPEDMRSS